MLIVVGDIHFRGEEPFYSALKDFVDWFVDQDFNDPKNEVLFLGDILHEAKSDGKTNYLMVDTFFNRLMFKKVYVIRGNHDYSKRFGDGLEPLEALDNLVLFKEPTRTTIHDLECLILPYYYPYSNKLPPMEEHYANLDVDWPLDLVFTHVPDETQTLDPMHIDLSYIKAQKISGHIHIPSENYLGSVMPTRFSENGKLNQIALIDGAEWKHPRIPIFLEYRELTYGDEKPKTPDFHVIWDIKEAPDKEAVYSMYPDLYIRTIHLKGQSERLLTEVAPGSQRKSRREYFEQFCQLNDIETEIQTRLLREIDDEGDQNLSREGLLGA